MAQRISTVDEHSPARKAGLHPGDELLTINGHEIRDVLDYRYYSADSKLLLEILRDGRKKRVRLKKEAGESLGLNFDLGLMDKPRSCVNHCVFCFIDQLPPGMRQTLYFKDDDARLSFLQGNYISLTNLSAREQQRIIDLRISPINVSVQATEPELRCRLLGNPHAGAGYGIMQRFAQAGIHMDCQIVVCPGYNDGAALDRSMADLAALYPNVSSVSIVPVGLTRHREGLAPLTPVDGAKAREIIAQVDAFASVCLEKYGTRIFCCGDELYRKAGLELPPWEYYEGFPQFENGVGMLRSLEDEFLEELEALGPRSASLPPPAPFSVATGAAAAPLLRKLLQIFKETWYAVDAEVYCVENRFFGSSVDVAGLLTGQDLQHALQGKALGERLLISANMLRHGGDMFLDDMRPEALSEALGVPIIPVLNEGRALLAAFLGYDPAAVSTERQDCKWAENL